MPSKPDSDFSRLAESLRGLCALLADDLTRGSAKGSAGQLESSSETLAGALGSTPSLNAIHHTTLLLVSSVDHARATAALIEAEDVVQAIATTARGSVEAAAQAHYLLTADDARDRVRRYTNLRLHDAFDRVRLAGLLGDNPGARKQLQDSARTRLADIVKAAEAAHFKVGPKGNDREAPQLIPRRGTMTQLCASLMNEAEPELGKAIYAMLSAIAHSSASGLMTHVQPMLPDLAMKRPGLTDARIGVSLPQLISQCVAVPMALAFTSAELYPLMGWSDGARSATASLTLDTWRRLWGIY